MKPPSCLMRRKKDGEILQINWSVTEASTEPCWRTRCCACRPTSTRLDRNDNPDLKGALLHGCEGLGYSKSQITWFGLALLERTPCVCGSGGNPRIAPVWRNDRQSLLSPRNCQGVPEGASAIAADFAWTQTSRTCLSPRSLTSTWTRISRSGTVYAVRSCRDQGPSRGSGGGWR